MVTAVDSVQCWPEVHRVMTVNVVGGVAADPGEGYEEQASAATGSAG